MPYEAAIMFGLLLVSGAALIGALYLTRHERLAHEARVALVARPLAAPSEAIGAWLKTRSGRLDVRLQRLLAAGTVSTWGMTMGTTALIVAAVVGAAAAWALANTLFGFPVLARRAARGDGRRPAAAHAAAAAAAQGRPRLHRPVPRRGRSHRPHVARRAADLVGGALGQRRRAAAGQHGLRHGRRPDVDRRADRGRARRQQPAYRPAGLPLLHRRRRAPAHDRRQSRGDARNPVRHHPPAPRDAAEGQGDDGGNPRLRLRARRVAAAHRR